MAAINWAEVSEKSVCTQADLDFIKGLRDRLTELRGRYQSFREHENEVLQRGRSAPGGIKAAVAAGVNRVAELVGAAPTWNPGKRRDALVAMLPDLHRARELDRTAYKRHSELRGLQKCASLSPANVVEFQLARTIYETARTFNTAASGTYPGDSAEWEITMLVPDAVAQRLKGLTRLRDFLGRADADIRAVVANFLAESEREIAVIERLVQSGNWSELEKAAAGKAGWWTKYETQ